MRKTKNLPDVKKVVSCERKGGVKCADVLDRASGQCRA